MKPIQRIIFLILVCSLHIQWVAASCIFADAPMVKELPIGNAISWTTIEEQNNHFFEILRSFDGINFERLSTIRTKGDAKATQTYRFLDVELGHTHSFYKIKQVDVDGDSSESPTAIVYRIANNNFMLSSVLGTWTDRLLTANILSAEEGLCTYQVLDYQEQVQLTGTIAFGVGKNTLNINMEGLKNGKYTLELLMNGEKEQLLVRKVPPTNVPQVNYASKQ